MTRLRPNRRTMMLGALSLTFWPRIAQSGTGDDRWRAALDAIEADFDDAPTATAARHAAIEALDQQPRSATARRRWAVLDDAARREAAFAVRFPYGRIEASKATPYRLHPFASSATLSSAAIDRDTARAQSDRQAGVTMPSPVRAATLDHLNKSLTSAAAPDIGHALERQRDVLAAWPTRETLSAGENYHHAALALKLGEAVDPSEMERKAIAMAQALEAEADALLRALWHRTGSVGERLRTLASNPAHRLPDTDAGRDRAVAIMNAALDMALARKREWFGTVPASADAIRVRRMSRADEARRWSGHRLLEGADAPAYFVDLADIGARPDWTLPGVVIHELCPGHIAQGLIEAPLDPHPLWLRYGGAFSEGWAIYAERLGWDAGLFANDPLARLGQLHGLLFRTGRALIDFGIHRHGWSAARAIQTLRDMQGFPVPYASFADDIVRCATFPGAFAGEWAGHMRIVELRDHVRAANPGDFSLARFHDRLLAQGTMPIGALPALFDR